MAGIILAAAITAFLLPGTLSSEDAIVWIESESPLPVCQIYVNDRHERETSGRSIHLKGLRSNSVYHVRVLTPDGEAATVRFRTHPRPKTLNVKDFGAVGDGRAFDTAALQAAIDHCPPFGTVHIPPGVYMTGALFIDKDNISLCIDAGAFLKAIPDLGAFPKVRNIYEGWEKDVYSSVLNIGSLHGKRHRGIRIYGGGTIDGSGSILAAMQTGKDGRMSRAHGLPVINCEDVAIEGITVRNPCTWNIHPLLCHGFTTYGCHLESAGFGLTNADGWDPDSSSGCFLVDSILDGQDDNVAIKSGSVPSEFIRVYNCHFLHGGGLAVGAELSAGANNIVFEQCKVAHCDRGIHVCSRPLGCGSISDIHFRDIDIDYAGCWGINVTLWYWIQNFVSQDFPLDEQLAMHDISFSDIHIGYADGNPIQVLGTVGRPVEKVLFDGIQIDSSRYDVVLRNCREVTISNSSTVGNYLVTENAEGLRLDTSAFREPVCPYPLADREPTYQTMALFSHLHKVAQSGRFLLGAQDATASGYGWNDDSGISDIERLTGEKPELYSWDFMDVLDSGGNFKASAEKIRRLACRAFYEGGINSFCWHMQNLSTGGGCYSLSDNAVEDILPGGARHAQFKRMLEGIAAFNETLIGKDGARMPIIFRPWHEFDGDWFWWGRKCRTKNQFRELYRYTVSYLKDTLGVHNFIWCYSPDINFTTEEEYLECYPGDDFVDILGLDNYWLYRPEAESVADATLRLKIISDYATKSGKVAALTETGQGGIPEASWFTDKLMKSIFGLDGSIRLAYVAFWRNSVQGYFTPFWGHPSETDFRNFLADDRVITLWKNDWLGMYYHL